jgi:hypothetical protein
MFDQSLAHSYTPRRRYSKTNYVGLRILDRARLTTREIIDCDAELG